MKTTDELFTTTDPDIKKLLEVSRELANIDAAIGLLRWDEETHMPKGAAEARGLQLATLEKIAHKILVSTHTEHLLVRGEIKLADYNDLTAYDCKLICLMRRAYRREAQVPEKLVGELAEARSLAADLWQKARAASDFRMFRDALERTVDLKLKEADCVGYAHKPYDLFLDDFEMGLTEDQASVFLDDVEKATHRIIATIQEDERVHQFKCELRKKLPRAGFEEFTVQILRAMKFDFDRGRQDVSTHPFTEGMHPTDVRVTTRFDEEFFTDAIFSSIHEGGHALYEQGIDSRLAYTLLGVPEISMALHESQSRLWENCIGRSGAFWTYWYPKLLELNPDIRRDSLSCSHLLRAINMVSPSFIRTDADEVTYNLHIVLRFRIERDLFAGKLTVNDLPEAWNELFAELLGFTGLRVPDDKHGVLQDVHWSHGLFGYFPSYALGNMYAAQIYRTLKKEFPDFDERIASGEMSFVREWLREKIHQHGALYRPAELLECVTGEKPSVGHFEKYLEEKFQSIQALF